MAWTKDLGQQPVMEEEVSRLVDCMVNRMRPYVPAIVFGALAQTGERRGIEEAAVGVVTLRRMPKSR